MKNELNAFLALLEDRPETFRELLSNTKRSQMIPATIQIRIRTAAENLKCQAVKDALREVYKRTLRLDPAARTPSLDSDTLKDAFYEGVLAVEEILDEVLKTCEEVEKGLGPRS